MTLPAKQVKVEARNQTKATLLLPSGFCSHSQKYYSSIVFGFGYVANSPLREFKELVAEVRRFEAKETTLTSSPRSVSASPSGRREAKKQALHIMVEKLHFPTNEGFDLVCFLYQESPSANTVPLPVLRPGASLGIKSIKGHRAQEPALWVRLADPEPL